MLRVFVSSTFSDLKEYRKAVRGIIRRIGAVDVAMEHLGARDEQPKELCLQLVRDGSDAFVGIYAHRYGSIPAGDTLSITELEYNEAMRSRKKCLIYIVDDECAWPPKFVDHGSAAELLHSFKNRLRQNHTYGSFTDKHELAASVAADIAREFAFLVYPLVGPGGATGRNPSSIEEWNAARVDVYRNSRNVFLAHTLRGSRRAGQEYDIALYLIPHRSNDPRYRRENLSDVVEAEFFLGERFGNKVFRVKNRGGTLGIVVSAYAPFLCTCRVRFSDGQRVILNRYIDFEMGPLIRPPTVCGFFGTVTVHGKSVAHGTVVSAWIDGAKKAECNTTIYQDSSVYILNVPGHDSLKGKDIIFKIGDNTAPQKGTYTSWANTKLDLEAT